MKAWQNITLQILNALVTAGNVGGQAAGEHIFGGGQTGNIINLATAAAAIFSGIVAHWYNPNGTPATTPYIPTPNK